MLFWYAAETVPAEIEEEYADAPSGSNQAGASRLYRPPPGFPKDITIKQRIAADDIIQNGDHSAYEPVWHSGTGVNEEEKLYRSYLLTVPEAITKLKGSVMADVIRRAWDGIEYRMEIEEESKGR
jgi:hypothetical protein